MNLLVFPSFRAAAKQADHIPFQISTRHEALDWYQTKGVRVAGSWMRHSECGEHRAIYLVSFGQLVLARALWPRNDAGGIEGPAEIELSHIDFTDACELLGGAKKLLNRVRAVSVTVGVS